MWIDKHPPIQHRLHFLKKLTSFKSSELHGWTTTVDSLSIKSLLWSPRLSVLFATFEHFCLFWLCSDSTLVFVLSSYWLSTSGPIGEVDGKRNRTDEICIGEERKEWDNIYRITLIFIRFSINNSISWHRLEMIKNKHFVFKTYS